jgi:DNA-3-methyladenine glycosylase
MFGPSGRLYVYFTYGMHYCINAVTGPAGYGSGVLIRAVEPVPDEANRDVFAILAKNRGGVSGTNLTNGPAKLTQALGIDMSLSGHDLRSAPLKLLPGSLRPGEAIVTSPRVGISKAKDLPRRFFITNNPYVSRAPKIT